MPISIVSLFDSSRKHTVMCRYECELPLERKISGQIDCEFYRWQHCLSICVTLRLARSVGLSVSGSGDQKEDISVTDIFRQLM